MTISATDKRLRQNAIPFQGKWFSNYTGTSTGAQLVNQIADGDLKAFADGGSAYVRIARPMKGDLVEARLSINAAFPVTGAAAFRCAIAPFSSDGVTASTLSLEEVDRQYKILTGQSSSFYYPSQGNLIVDGLNLMPLIPKRGETNFNEDGFIIYLELTIKDNATDFALFEFKVDCSIQMAEVQA